MSARETWAGCLARAAGQAAREYVLAGKWLRASEIQQAGNIWIGEGRERVEEEEEAGNSIPSIHVACDVVQAVM